MARRRHEQAPRTIDSGGSNWLGLYLSVTKIIANKQLTNTNSRTNASKDIAQMSQSSQSDTFKLAIGMI